MREKELSFVIPTHRLRDVGETIEQHDEHFRRNGHTARMVVFDDSTPTNQQKYYPLLEQTRTHHELYYVGPREKEQFLAYLNSRLRDKRLEGLVRNLFRPSYGGNRNFTLMYTLGELMVSSDDDMRPYSFIEYSPESLAAEEVCRGRLHRNGEDGYTRKSFDIVAAFLDVLGKPVAEIPENYDRGDLLLDSSMELETNATKGLARENSLTLHPGAVADDAIVKIAQTSAPAPTISTPSISSTCSSKTKSRPTSTTRAASEQNHGRRGRRPRSANVAPWRVRHRQLLPSHHAD
jgi:hypothetical protein